MFAAVVLVISAALIAGIVKLVQIYRPRFQFFVSGLDAGFSYGEISLLWKTAQLCALDQPSSLFWSAASLARCISRIKYGAQADGSANSAKVQNILSKLYAYRTKIEKDADKRRGLASTRSLGAGQPLRIILPGKGVFASEAVNSGRELAIRLPTRRNGGPVPGRDWVGRTISVYFWRTGDARYVFDTPVLREGMFLGKPALYLRHTDRLLRTQKRNAIRAKCEISAALYILREKQIDFNRVETKPGLRCLIEDISESGALIRIGGKGVSGVRIQIQFQLKGRLVIMFGIVRHVDYNAARNQSRLHFECVHVDPGMRNEILSYVYNILPQNEKDVYAVMTMMDREEKAASDGRRPEPAAGGSSGTGTEGKEPPSAPVPADAENLPDLEPFAEAPDTPDAAADGAESSAGRDSADGRRSVDAPADFAP